ncbi:hypothetical protein DPX16_2464 [Anabarilius grahami]|uniref:HAT C-terminal dimerisation domain-containing protein n=1 Tax=Anabarilius grahami TaxID=495550 RepID=A0A3N0Z5Y4_ANAGA|nr:hypothetical protein DPX16_2464 [Anabarilius grahami]
MDPKHFPEIREKGLPEITIKELSKCILQFDERVGVETLQAELISLAQQWERLKQLLMENYNIRSAASSDETWEGSEVPDEIQSAYCFVDGLGYKFLPTLSITQVACEKTFSTVTLVKNRLRNSLSQENLEAFLFTATDKLDSYGT